MNIQPFALERYFAPYEHTARYMLSSSDCESLSIGDLLAYEPDAAERFSAHWLGYTEYEGDPTLRDAIAATCATLRREHVLVFSGAEEAIYTYMNTALTAGDHIIVHAPGYQSLYEVARANGVDVTLWQADEGRGWALDLDWLRDHLQPNTRTVVVNTPHNPTGWHMDAAFQAALIDLLRARGIRLFSDEVYRGLEFDAGARLPAAADLYEGAVSLGVMSKAYGLAGLRIGWIATQDTALLRQMNAFKDYLTICNSAPSEWLAALALRHGDALVARNRQIIADNLVLLDAFFARHANRFAWVRPRAGAIGFPRILWDADTAALSHDLVMSRSVLLIPGSLFFHGDRHFRIGFGRRNLPVALGEFEAFVAG